MFRSLKTRLFVVALLVMSAALPVASQTRTEFLSKDLTFSFHDTDRFADKTKGSTTLIDLQGPDGLTLVVSKRSSSAKSLTEISQTLPESLSSKQQVKGQRMTTVGEQLATLFEIENAQEPKHELLAIVLRDRQEYRFILSYPDQGTWNGDNALALLDKVVWTKPQSMPDAPLHFRSSDKSFTLSSPEDFRVSYNPHAVLSLASLEETVVVVTKTKAEKPLSELYENLALWVPTGARCVGRMMITLGDEQAGSFVLEGMFPPKGPATHQTLFAIVIRDGQEYNFMVHYPLDNLSGLEDAYSLLSTLQWTKP